MCGREPWLWLFVESVWEASIIVGETRVKITNHLDSRAVFRALGRTPERSTPSMPA
jgi:hypothetical protein